MPNGGSDCCGNCIFKKIIEKEKRTEIYLDTYCKIREKIIIDPHQTYCANFHTHCKIPQ